MSGFEQVAWLPLCGGLAVVGVLLSWLVWRRRGAAAGLRGVAWSLIPIAAYLTGLIELIWQVVAAGVGWALRLVFSPVVWSGVAVAGLCAVLFLVSGVLRRRTSPEDRAVPSRESGEAPKQVTQGSRAGGEPSDDFAEIEEILRRRGIS
ncbi:MAG: cellulose synthase [Streptosporangiales bacterium]|nr:cellulose synthase [Streptosporangiales bacterium]